MKRLVGVEEKPRNEPGLLDDFVTVTDLLDLFRVTPMTLRAWRMRLGLPSYHVGSSHRKITLFHLPSVQAWARAHDKTIFGLQGNHKGRALVEK